MKSGYTPELIESIAKNPHKQIIRNQICAQATGIMANWPRNKPFKVLTLPGASNFVFEESIASIIRSYGLEPEIHCYEHDPELFNEMRVSVPPYVTYHLEDVEETDIRGYNLAWFDYCTRSTPDQVLKATSIATGLKTKAGKSWAELVPGSLIYYTFCMAHIKEKKMASMMLRGEKVFSEAITKLVNNSWVRAERVFSVKYTGAKVARMITVGLHVHPEATPRALQHMEFSLTEEKRARVRVKMPRGKTSIEEIREFVTHRLDRLGLTRPGLGCYPQHREALMKACVREFSVSPGVAWNAISPGSRGYGRTPARSLGEKLRQLYRYHVSHSGCRSEEEFLFDADRCDHFVHKAMKKFGISHHRPAGLIGGKFRSLTAQ